VDIKAVACVHNLQYRFSTGIKNTYQTYAKLDCLTIPEAKIMSNVLFILNTAILKGDVTFT